MTEVDIRILQNQLEILRRQAPLLRRIAAVLGIASDVSDGEYATEKLITHHVIAEVRSG